MSNQISQKEAVFSAVVSVFNSSSVNFTSGVDNAHSLLNSAMRMEITSIIVDGLMDGTVSFGKTGLTRSQVRTYASGLLSNWLKKDTRLSGGIRVSNPARKNNSTNNVVSSKNHKLINNDTQIKALKSLLKIKTDPSEIAEIEGFINKRMSEITGISVNA